MLYFSLKLLFNLLAPPTLNFFCLIFSYFRRQGEHGGIIEYIRTGTEIDAYRRTDLEDNDIERVTLELKIRSDRFLFFCCNRPPTMSPTTFFDELSDLYPLLKIQIKITPLQF